MANLWSLDSSGRLTLNFHPAQSQCWQSRRRFTAFIAGTQSGKTSYGPWHLWQWTRTYGGGDYIAATASYDLFKLKMLPEILNTFEHVLRIGRYWSGDKVLELQDPTTERFLARRGDDPMWGRIILRSAQSEGGLESASARGAWLDEAGQDDFGLGAWEAVLRRLSLSRGPVLITTTPYNLGWLKSQVYDRWRAGDPDYLVVQADSTINPLFPKEELERARRDLPRWKFDLFYRGVFTRPAGLIYDSFDEDRHKCPRFAIPVHWPRYLGLDFGGVNTAGLFYAEEPGTNRLYLYREYKAGGRTAAEHAQALLKGEPGIPVCVGGSRSEGQWRSEFRAGGLPVREPGIREVEVGIDRVYGCHKRGEIIVFDDLAGYLNQKMTYSRVLNDAAEPTEAIENKSEYHFMDAERYIVGWLKRPTQTREAKAW